MERFVKSAAAILKRSDFDYELFIKRMEKNYQVLERVEFVPLDSPYTKALEEYVNTVFSTIKHEDDEEALHVKLLREVNGIEKLKNNISYKKSKHKSKDFDDGN